MVFIVQTSSSLNFPPTPTPNELWQRTKEDYVDDCDAAEEKNGKATLSVMNNCVLLLFFLKKKELADKTRKYLF